MCFYCTCLWSCIPIFRVCTPGLSDTAEEVCGSFSRCTESEEVLTRPQLCQICPNQTRGAGETQAAHRWDSKNKGNRQREEEGRHRVQHHPSNLVPDRGQEHGFQRLKSAVTTSRKIMRLSFVEWRPVLLFPMSYWFGGSIYQHVRVEAV